MAERIIPIQIDNENDVDQQETGRQLSEPMEQLAIDQKKSSVQIQVKPVKENKNLDKYLKEFDLFEERSKCTLPCTNVPEKIILVIDRAYDEKCTPFITEKAKFTPLSMLRRTVNLFLVLKHMINKNHEFALVVLNDSNASWLQKFTTDIKRLNNALDRITQCDVEDSFDLDSLFNEIAKHIQVPEVNSLEVAPPHIIRVVLLYGRSYTIPTVEFNEETKKMLENPYFIVDVLMTHEPVDESNHCSKIFESLQNIDKKGLAYFFPVCRDARRLHSSMAKLLAHPLQRPIQKLQKT